MTITRLEVRTRRTAVSSGRTASSRCFVCAECRHAQLFAVQPRALCTCASSDLADKIVFAGQPACPNLAPRKNAWPLLAWCTPGLKRTSRRFSSGPSR